MISLAVRIRLRETPLSFLHRISTIRKVSGQRSRKRIALAEAARIRKKSRRRKEKHVARDLAEVNLAKLFHLEVVRN